MQEKNKLAFKVVSALFGVIFLLGSIYQIVSLFQSPTQSFVTAKQLLDEAAIAIEKKDYTQALNHVEKAKQIQEEAKQIDFNTYSLLGKVNHKLGRLPEAVLAYRQFLKHVPEDALVHEELAVIYGKQKKYDWLETELKWLLKQNPKNYYALNNLAVAYIEQNKLAQAEQPLQKALAIRDDFVDTYRNLGFLYKLKKDSKKSKEYFTKYLRLAPDAPDAAAVKKML